jgi:hypothetical protein
MFTYKLMDLQNTPSTLHFSLTSLFSLGTLSMSVEKDINSVDETEPKAGDLRKVTAKTHEAELKAAAHDLDKKESLSAYFTILAAGFGLISDGCKFSL